MIEKKRILFCGEASFLNTGFSNIYRSLLPRLVATNKYEIAEHGNYADSNHPDIQNFIAGRWKFYPGMPSNQTEAQEFNKFVQSPHPRDRGQNIAQFGAWNFDQVVADFQPDICIDIRDNWMWCWMLRSPFRSWMKMIMMPTVDSPQQAEEWIDDYEKVNMCLAYSDFGIHTLKSQSPKIKIFPEPMRPGVDLDIFKPSNKVALREKFNLGKDIPIIGLVQRNQSRKNILDVIDSFAMMKNKYRDDDLIQKSVLLIHSSWPDNMYSFDYPRHIKRINSSKWMQHYSPNIMYSILQTLICHNCNQSSVCFAVNLYGKPVQRFMVNGKQVAGILMPCTYCGKNTATCSNTAIGHSREQLAEIYNLMDVLVQCSIAEGDGMPATESKACGVPVIVTDHSALIEKGRFPKEFVHLNGQEKTYTINKGGIIHKIAAHRHEPETGCLRAVPDVKDLAEKMRLLVTDTDLRSKMSKEARECAEENYDWNKLAKRWEYVLDNVKIIDRQKTWESPITPQITIAPHPVPENLSDEQYVHWLYLNVLKYPSVDPDGAKMWIDHLMRGISRQQIMDQFIMIGNQQSDSSKTRDMLRNKIAINSNTQVQEFV